MRHKRKRLDAILTAVAEGPADVEALAARFGVSPSTIRRDLADLSRTQAIARTYGGAMLAGGTVLAAPERETSLRARTARNHAAKLAIARAALAEVRDGETLILDGGSTVEALGRLLVARRLRVVTSNLALLPVLAAAEGIQTVVLGGALRPISMSTVGPLAEAALRGMTADRVFTSADGVVPSLGLCEATAEQASLKALMLARAAAAYVLADSTKLHRASQPFWVPFRPGWTLVTDAAGAALEGFAAEGLRVMRA